MVCGKVLALLSEYLDEVLDADASARVSEHLSLCAPCRREFESLAAVRNKLRSMGGVQAPECLRSLVRHRIARLKRDLWYVRLKDGLERAWSRIRTLEGTWYVTRALGTAAASALFFMILYAGPQLPVKTDAPEIDLRARPDFQRQVSTGVLANLGLIPGQPKGYRRPAIRNDYFLKYSQSIPPEMQDDDFSVVAYVDPSGATEIQYVLKNPSNENLLSSFIDYISCAQSLPASRNGVAVPSYLVLTYNKISIHD